MHRQVRDVRNRQEFGTLDVPNRQVYGALRVMTCLASLGAPPHQAMTDFRPDDYLVHIVSLNRVEP